MTNGQILTVVFQSTCVVSHGQASVERGFSLNQSLLLDNMNELSIVSHRAVKDYMRAHNNLVPSDVTRHQLVSREGSTVFT